MDFNDRKTENVNLFGEDIMLPPNFQHPNWGKYKTQPEGFFTGMAVRILADVEVGGATFLTAIWLDVVRFEDTVIDGSPCRMGVGPE